MFLFYFKQIFIFEINNSYNEFLLLPFRRGNKYQIPTIPMVTNPTNKNQYFLKSKSRPLFQQSTRVSERGGHRGAGARRGGGAGARERLPLAHQGLRRHLQSLP